MKDKKKKRRGKIRKKGTEKRAKEGIKGKQQRMEKKDNEGTQEKKT